METSFLFALWRYTILIVAKYDVYSFSKYLRFVLKLLVMGLVIELQMYTFPFLCSFFQVLNILYIFTYLNNYLHGEELRGRHFPFI